MSDLPELGRLFFEVHRGLPREGPGSDASTRRALALAAPHLPEAPRIVDVGCGPGAQTRVLATELSGASLVALDFYGPFLEQLRVAVEGTSLSSRIERVEADMTTWMPSASVDMVWCEGAAYLMGVPAALDRWASWLRPGGVVAFSDAIWLTDRPSVPVADLWTAYPAMVDRAGCLELVDEAGYERLGDFVLPRSDWLDDYYRPMARRLDELEAGYAGDDAAMAELAEHRREIEVFEAQRDEYSYLFVVARWPG